MITSNVFISLLLLLEMAGNSPTIAQTHTIEEKIVNGFHVSIYLPPAYNKTNTYKVLYVNDGQSVFGTEGLNLDGVADDLISQKRIEPLIIVAIYSDQNRTSNYIPYADEGVKQEFGLYHPDAAQYTQKIINKIIPFVEKNYSTSADRGIAGYSFGGLHATWAALNYPKTFRYVAALSPSYWVNDFQIFKEASKAESNQLYYFDIGTGEWNYYVPFITHTKLHLLQNIFYFEVVDAQHQITDWAKRMSNVLLLFAGKTDLTTYTWKVQQEVIKSKGANRFYLRINPVITYSNGLQTSLSYAAKFTLLNPEDGVVNADGSFRFINPKDLTVKISYQNEEHTITIRYQDIEKIKSSL